ncbi:MULTISPECIES: hypothetical protein [unclassified Bradyrhizobium]|uniref:hypothetical protein n=1 Tax=unclassified Bradyrhizobium TaxID=2631580 RepID=UPI002916866C|nr:MULTISPECIES: hypothetical protein [unclassified Bradyrhizobium]
MQNFVQPVNVEALKNAMEAAVGPEVTDTIIRVYKAIDQAMFAGYTMGQQDAMENIDERLDRAFDTGFAEGMAADDEIDDEESPQSSTMFDHAYDEGYVSGVADARARPEVADRNVQDIINDGAAEHYDELAQLDLFEDASYDQR